MNFIYWLLCLIIGLLPAWIIYRNDRKKNIPVKWLPAILRFFTCFITGVLLLAPAFPSVKQEEEQPILLWLQDNSSSMSKALGTDSVDYRSKMTSLKNKWKDGYKLVTFAFGGDTRQDSIFRFDQRSTDIAQAMQQATSQYQDQNIGAVILSSDGIFNEGLDPLYAPIGAAIPMYTIGIGDSAQPKDLYIVRVYANKTVALNSTFEVIVDLRAEKLKGFGGNMSVLHHGSSRAQVPFRIEGDRYTTSTSFTIKATEKGFQRYTIVVPGVDGEENVLNNRMDFFVEVVDEQNKVLIWAAAPHPDIGAIKEALESVPQYKIDVKIGGALPEHIGLYTMMIAHQLPNQVTAALPKTVTVPIWYILGRQSNSSLFNQQQNLLQISGSAGSANDVLPLLNPTFSFFTLPSNINEVLVKMPPLQVPYGTYTPAAGSQILFRQQIGSVQTAYPLWLMQTGVTPCAVLAGEGLWRWRMYEYKNFKRHEIVDELIRQTVSLLSAKKDARPFRIFMDKYVFSDNEVVNAYGELRNENGELINTGEAQLVIKDSLGNSKAYGFEKNGNSYRINLGLLAPGHYSIRGNTVYNGRAYAAEASFVVESVPLEQLRTYADYEILSKLSKQSGGSFFTLSNMTTLADSLRTNPTIKPIIHTEKTFTQWIDKKWLFLLILVFAASEWLLRKYWSV